MNLKNRIQSLADSTTSNEVKNICQKYLKESKDVDFNDQISESLFNELKEIAKGDDLVSALLKEHNDINESKRKVEARISKQAAERLMEANWSDRPKNVNLVGNHKNNTIESENKDKASKERQLIESLSNIAESDPSAAKVLSGLRSESYGMSEAIAAIKTSKVMNMPQLKYAVARFEEALANEVSESRIVGEFLSNMNGFTWDPTVNEAYSKVKTAVDARSVELQVQNAIYQIAESDKQRFFDQTIQKLNNWLVDEKRTVPALIKEMKQWMFNPIIKNLVNNIALLENSHGNKFNIPVSSSNCTVSKVYSPIISVNEGIIFKVGDNFFISNKNGITKLTDAQINGLPKQYLQLCESFFNDSIRVGDNGIQVHIGRTKVTINESGTFINEAAIEPSELGQRLMYHTQSTIFKAGDENSLIGHAVRIQENIDSIIEIDYAKGIFSNVYEGVCAYIFKKEGKIYINKNNPSMNENTFYEVNAVQAVNAIKGFLGYDISESLVDMLDGDLKQKAIMEGQLNDVLTSIQIVEGELNRVESEITDNPAIAEVPEIVETKEMLENELNTLKSQWQKINADIKKFENILEAEEEASVEVCANCGNTSCTCTTIKDKGSKKKSEEEFEEEESKKKKSNDKKDDDDDGDNDGDVPTNSGEGKELEEKAIPTVSTPSTETGDVVNTGLAGAEGPQSTEINGNDYLMANADSTDTPGVSDTNVVNSGYAGADGSQDQAQSIDGGANAANVQATSVTAEITIPANIETAAVEQQPNTGEPVAQASNIFSQPKDSTGSVTNVVTETPAATGAAGVPTMNDLPNSEGEEKTNESSDAATDSIPSKEEFERLVKSTISDKHPDLVSRLIKAYDVLDVEKPASYFGINMTIGSGPNAGKESKMTGREVMFFTSDGLNNVALLDGTSKYDELITVLDNIYRKGKSSKTNEALDVNVPVKLKGCDKTGKITAANTVNSTYTVLWDGGETGEYTQGQLEELTAEIANNSNDNKIAAGAAEKKQNEAKEEGDDTEEQNIQVWTKAKVTIDFGPFKADEIVDIDASQFVSAGDEDGIKLKNPKDEIATVPKKYLKVEDSGENIHTELSNKLENVIKNLEEIETLTKESDKINNAEISDALGKIKAFRQGISA